MVKSIRIFLLFVFAGSLFLSTQAIAEEGRGNIGIGSKSLAISVTSASNVTSQYEWTGSALTAEYDFTSWLSLNGSVYDLTENVDSNSKMRGLDIGLRLGINDVGVVYSCAIGYFNDKWIHPKFTASQSISGVTFGGGIGYNWDHVNLNLEAFSLRFSSDYENNFGSGVSRVNSTQLSVAYRF